ncbi:hypothetical protein ASPWEDRAFT_39784 [Aspergillus wentii DTO 134E9]|uniref:Hydrophobin n=1 Tax=Aspergillus wentii DTO 134E9 TaxID=1073089 RepID=A0A1L9RIF6_ASPWE|nr:uncharacterized protein ASPWEDRAFT_39784 [Aspergillus wentii DTO 134E9]KAI9932326.1 hypothetical protein MW887_009838 [Aspergillus wentii]OJJ34709.1 hypothetical protein ASPWEDRAFT_39784 [Aspergillus wentii DTO 134E9]
MKFFTIAALAATVAALPSPQVNNNDSVRFPVGNDVDVHQAQAKCGDQAKLSCCNKASYSGDTTAVNNGLLSGVLSGLLGAGGSSEGLGLFDQCSELSVTALLGLNNLVNQQCKQNIACCQNSESNANGGLINVAVPCIALGSIL